MESFAVDGFDDTKLSLALFENVKNATHLKGSHLNRVALLDAGEQANTLLPVPFHAVPKGTYSGTSSKLEIPSGSASSECFLLDYILLRNEATDKCPRLSDAVALAAAIGQGQTSRTPM